VSPINPNAVMGFENPTYWSVLANGKTPDTNVKSSTVRTQGNAALSVLNPPALITLTSVPVASSATALTGIANNGAVLQMDVRLQLPASTLAADEVLNTEVIPGSTASVNYMDGFVTVKSLGLNNVPLGRVVFQNFRAGIYETVSYTIPESLSSALHGKTFNDMVFQFTVSLTHAVNDSYLFDNLRIHSVELQQTPTGTAPPAGYGTSLDLLVAGSKPVTHTFTLAPAQIPGGFHLKQGIAGTSTVQFQLGLDSIPALTCSYVNDKTDKTGQSYVLSSCTGGFHAGDLVNSNWVSLGILQATATQRLDAQLSLSPLGGLSGSGLIPPMPTYWGDATNCAPAPVAGKVVTKSTSCASQTAHANQIITEYFNAVNGTHPSGDWVVAPVPESATRSGTGAPSVAAIRPNVAPDDLTFNTGGDLNPGGSFDAYWRLSGNLIPTAVANTDENTTHFDADFTTHGVLFGDDVDVVDAKVTLDTDSGQTTPAYKPATSSGTLGFYVFGEEIPSGGLTFNPSTGFSVDPSWTQEYDLPSIQIWIFDITLGANVEADLKAQGSAALTGADLSVIPTATLGGHISGGINLGIASGDVDAKVNLVTLSAPFSAQAKFALDTDPAVCASELTGSLKGDLDISSGGGEVDLDATFGYCPFCYTDSYTLFKWSPLASHSWNLFNDTLSFQVFGLPASLCPLATTVNITSPAAGASLSAGVPVQLTGSAVPTDPLATFYNTTYNWSFTPGANASTAKVNPAGANSANPVVTFGTPKSGTTSTWTIGMTATTTVQSQGGALLTKTTSAAPVQVTVTGTQPGDYITQVLTEYNGPATPLPDGSLNVGNAPGLITINAAVVGITGNLNTVFSVSYCNDGTAACSDPGPAFFPTVTTIGGNTTTPSATWGGFSGGYFSINMITTSNGATVAGTHVILSGSELL
jgi:hypothetical protein